jgi:hypothetical protein
MCGSSSFKQERALALVTGCRCGATEFERGFDLSPKSFEQMAAHAREEIIALQRLFHAQLVECLESRRWSVSEANRDRAIERHDGRGHHLYQGVVQRNDTHQSVSSAMRARAWHAAIAACSA